MRPRHTYFLLTFVTITYLTVAYAIQFPLRRRNFEGIGAGGPRDLSYDDDDDDSSKSRHLKATPSTFISTSATPTDNSNASSRASGLIFSPYPSHPPDIPPSSPELNVVPN